MSAPALDARTRTLAALWALGSVMILGLALGDVQDSVGWAIPKHGVVIGRDFVNMWVGGRMAAEGALAHVYDPLFYLAFLHDLWPAQVQHNYSYPPHTLLLGLPLSQLSYPAALGVWTVATGALFYRAAAPFVRGFPAWAAVLTPAAVANVWDGQYGFLAGALFLRVFAQMEVRPVRAGLAAGLLTVKPHLGLLLPLVMLVRRRFAVIAVAALAATGCVLLSGAMFGFGLWRDFIAKVPPTQAHILAARGHEFYLLMMPTARVALRGWPDPLPSIGQLLFAAAALALLWRARAAPPHELAFPTATATFLILPYAFNYDMPVANLGFAVLLASRWDSLRRWEIAVLGAGFMLPQLTFVFGVLHLPFAPAILLACLWVQVRHATPAGRFSPA